MKMWLRALLVTPLLLAVVVDAVNAPGGGQLMQVGSAMPPCKRCGAARLHSRDDLLAMDDGELLKMQDTFSKDVTDLEEDLDEQKKKQAAELGKLTKRLSDMDTAYKKLGKDAIDHTAKFASAKAKASKDLDGSLDATLETQTEIAKLHASMDELRKFLIPYVDKFTSGKGWPHGCKCAKAKALLQRLQANLRLASPPESLLRRSSKIDPAKYKLVREVQQLEEKRAKLTQEKTQGITSYSEEQRRTLDRIDTAKIKANLKSSTERKYKDSDASLEKNLKNQQKAADSYRDGAKAQLERLKKHDEASLKLFKSFKAELAKCKCI